MTDSTILVIVLVCALLVVGFFAVFRGEGGLSIEFNWLKKVLKINAKGKNPPPTSAAPTTPTALSGVKMEEIEAGGDIDARSDAGVDLKKAKAGGDIRATSSSHDPPPK
jgi:hypothetical protein